MTLQRASTATVISIDQEGPYGNNVVLDLSSSTFHQVTLHGNRVIVLQNDLEGMAFSLILEQDSVGSRSVTWWPGIRWQGGSAPTLTTTPGAIDIFSFIRRYRTPGQSPEYLGLTSNNF